MSNLRRTSDRRVDALRARWAAGRTTTVTAEQAGAPQRQHPGGGAGDEPPGVVVGEVLTALVPVEVEQGAARDRATARALQAYLDTTAPPRTTSLELDL